MNKNMTNKNKTPLIRIAIGKTVPLYIALLSTLAIAQGSTQQTISIDHLQPLGINTPNMALIVQQAISTGCPADSEKRLTLAMPADSAERMSLLLQLKAIRSSQAPMTVTLDLNCDDSQAAVITALTP